MNQLNDYRDRWWYYQNAQRAADEAFMDKDEIEARKYRKIALGVMMLPFMNVMNMSSGVTDRLLDVAQINDVDLHTIKHATKKISDLRRNNDHALFARWKNEDGTDTPDRFEIEAGNLQVGMSYEAGDEYYQIDIDVFARFSLASSLCSHDNAPLSLFGVQFAALPDRIQSDIVTPPPSHLAIAPIESLDEAIAGTNSEFNNKGINWQRIYNSKQIHALD